MFHTATERKAEHAGTAWSDRRAWVRFCCNLGSSCRPVAWVRETPWAGTLVDISQGGVGLLLNRRFEVGTLLAIELQKPDGVSLGHQLARVAHCSPRGVDWIVGCAFLHPLSEDELRELVPEA